MTEAYPKANCGLLFVLSGPSATGKGTVRRSLHRLHPELHQCASVTTRRPRPGEVAGVSYIFTDESDFRQREKSGEFLECANVYGNLYGTPKAPVIDLLSKGCDVVLEKDTQGALSIKDELPEAILVFLAPPSVEELVVRIRKRGTEDDADIARRLSRAQDELGKIELFDYVVVNYDVEQTVKVLQAIILAERHKVGHHSIVRSASGGEVSA